MAKSAQEPTFDGEEEIEPQRTWFDYAPTGADHKVGARFIAPGFGLLTAKGAKSAKKF